MTQQFCRPLSCVVVDDEPLARELIVSYVRRTPGLQLEASFDSAADALRSILAAEVDIVFLDINMPLLNGIEFATLIPERTRIVYITAYDRYAVDGFRVNALDYLLKPVSYPEFMKAVNKAVEWYAMRDNMAVVSSEIPRTSDVRDAIVVKADSRLVRMKIDSILYIEVRKDRLIFVRRNGDTVTSLMSMREIEGLLPPDIFMRVHRSFIVNLRNVEIVERNRIVFGKEYIPIADSRRDEFLSRLS